MASTPALEGHSAPAVRPCPLARRRPALTLLVVLLVTTGAARAEVLSRLWEPVESLGLYQARGLPDLALASLGVTAWASHNMVGMFDSQPGPAPALNDGDRHDYWVSCYQAYVKDPVQIILTFPQPTTFNGIYWTRGSAGPGDYRTPRDYDLRVSDDRQTWTTVLQVRGNLAHEHYGWFKPVTARYLMMEILCVVLPGQERGFPALNELEVYNYDPAQNQAADWWDARWHYRLRLPAQSGARRSWGVDLGGLIDNGEPGLPESVRVVAPGATLLPCAFVSDGTRPDLGRLVVDAAGHERDPLTLYLDTATGGTKVAPPAGSLASLLPPAGERLPLRTALARRNFTWEEPVLLQVSAENPGTTARAGSLLVELREEDRCLLTERQPLEVAPGGKHEISLALRHERLRPGEYEVVTTWEGLPAGGAPPALLARAVTRVGLWQPVTAALPFGFYAMEIATPRVVDSVFPLLREHHVTSIALDTPYGRDEALRYGVGVMNRHNPWAGGDYKTTGASGRALTGGMAELGGCLAEPKVTDYARSAMAQIVREAEAYPAFSKRLWVNDDCHLTYGVLPDQPEFRFPDGKPAFTDLACYCDHCRAAFRAVAGVEPPRPWQVDQTPRVVPDDDLWLRWNRYRVADIMGGFNRAVEEGKAQVDPQVRLGAVHGCTVPFFVPALGHYPPLEQLDLVSSYFYPCWYADRRSYLAESELSRLGHRGAPTWLLGGMLYEWGKAPDSLYGMEAGLPLDAYWPRSWTVFGPCRREDRVPAPEVLALVPEALAVGGQTFRPRTVPAPDGRLDFHHLFGSHAEGQTAYAFAVLQAPRQMEITVGASADWWMQWWLDGKPVFDTLDQGNGSGAFRVLDHQFPLSLTAGRHVLAVRCISGAGSWQLATGGPAAIAAQEQRDRDPAAAHFYAPPGYTRNVCWYLLAGGQKLISLFSLGTGGSGPEDYLGHLPPSSAPMREAKEFGALCAAYGATWSRMQPVHQPVAVLASFTHACYDMLTRDPYAYPLALRRQFDLLAGAAVPVEFVAEEEVAAGYLNQGTRVVVLTQEHWLSAACRAGLERFQAAGGTVVVTPEASLPFAGARVVSPPELPGVCLSLAPPPALPDKPDLRLRAFSLDGALALVAVNDNLRQSWEGRVRLAGSPGLAYDSVRRLLLGSVPGEVSLTIGPGGGTVIEVLPAAIGALQVTAAPRAPAGQTQPLYVTLWDPLGHLLPASVPLSVSLRDPRGALVDRVPAAATRAGRAALRLPWAVNDSPGRWQVTVQELLSGRQATTVVDLRAP